MADSALTRARGWLFDIFAHHHAERLRTHRAVERQVRGVDMTDYPYPGANSGNTLTTNNNTGGLVKGAVLSAALLAAGGAGALGLGLLSPKSTGTAASPTAPATMPAKQAPFDIRVPWKVGKDGKAEIGQPQVTPVPGGP